MAAPAVMPLPSDTLPKFPMPKANTTEFLASSHFRISQDDTATKDSLNSVFKRDYIPWNITSKPASSVPPAPADVLTRDDRYFNDKISETRQTYQKHFLPKPEIRSDGSKLRATNFKMDKDINKFNCYDTTHGLDYPAKLTLPLHKRGANGDPMKSSIPQGDREKIGEPSSDYRECFQGVDALKYKPAKAPSAHQGGPPTIKGDEREPQFSTTHGDTFQGRSTKRVRAFPAPTGTNIPQGDRLKERRMETVHQMNYQPQESEMKGYNKNAVMEKLGKTNFKQVDGTGNWNRSLMNDSYTPKHGDTITFVPTKHRNHSDFPEGDANPNRNSTRANLTTNRFYHGNPPQYDKPEIVLGANKRTKSNVWFGEPRLGRNFYDTTTDGVYRPVTVPYSYSRHDFNTKSVVPLSYYAGHQGNSTYSSDFENPIIGKLVPNPEGIRTLRESHILPQLGGYRQFSTENLEQYQPKRTCITPIDAGRLQRSSVPLGTMGQR